MKKQIKILILLSTIVSIGLLGCKKDDVENEKTLDQLYQTYKNGEISECRYNRQRVYFAGLVFQDGVSSVYDLNGKNIGTCNYSWGPVDSICNELEDCEVIYRAKDNIWGLPAIDKYGLGKRADK